MPLGYVDHASHLALAELESDIAENLRAAETSKLPNSLLIGSQPEVSWDMRAHLVEYLVQLQSSMDVSQSALYLAINLVDRYMSNRVVHLKHLQLLGTVCMWTAAKVSEEKTTIPSTQMLNFITCSDHPDSMYKDMELHVLATLNWEILAPTVPDFVDLFVGDVARKLNAEMNAESAGSFEFEMSETNFNGMDIPFGTQDYSVVRSMVNYIGECTLGRKEFVGVLPSTIAASAVALSVTVWDTMQDKQWPSVYPAGSTKECFDALMVMASQAPEASAARYSGENQYAVSHIMQHFFTLYAALRTSYLPQVPMDLSQDSYSMESHPETPVHSRHASVVADRNTNDITMPLTPDTEVPVDPNTKYMHQTRI